MREMGVDWGRGKGIGTFEPLKSHFQPVNVTWWPSKQGECVGDQIMGMWEGTHQPGVEISRGLLLDGSAHLVHPGRQEGVQPDVDVHPAALLFPPYGFLTVQPAQE